MSDSRSRPIRRPAARKDKAVGGRPGNKIPVLFIVGVVAVVLAFVVLFTVAADAFGGGEDPTVPAVVDSTETTEPVATNADGSPVPTKTPSNTATPTAGPDGTILVTCGDILAPVDKKHKLAADCAPPDLQPLPGEFSSGTQKMRSQSAAAMVEMLQDARTNGFAMYVNSSYRNFQEQEYTYNFWAQQYGKEQADRTSARPGHSEHQMGTTADVGWNGCELECTEGTKEAAWLADNAHRFGFIVSYPDGKEQITGYAFEPWHVRFVGKEKAQEVKDSGLTLHEFLLK